MWKGDFAANLRAWPSRRFFALAASAVAVAVLAVGGTYAYVHASQEPADGRAAGATTRASLIWPARDQGAAPASSLPPVPPASFSIACPGTAQLDESGGGQASCTVRSINGFTERVDLSCAAKAVACRVDPSQISPRPNGSTTFKLGVSHTGRPSASLGVEVMGRSGALIASDKLTFRSKSPIAAAGPPQRGLPPSPNVPIPGPSGSVVLDTAKLECDLQKAPFVYGTLGSITCRMHTTGPSDRELTFGVENVGMPYHPASLEAITISPAHMVRRPGSPSSTVTVTIDTTRVGCNACFVNLIAYSAPFFVNGGPYAKASIPFTVQAQTSQ
jgi:hypothetical protein